MNRRDKRITLGVMAVGLGVVLVLAIAYRTPILDHLVAWRFQLTRETETTINDTGPPLVFDPAEIAKWTHRSLMPWDLSLLRESRYYRVIEQRFPRRAYVIIRKEPQKPREEASP